MALIFPLISTASESGSTLTYKHEYFWDRNGVWNQTPVFSLHAAINRKWSFGWEQEIDIVTGASRRLGLKNRGGTGDNKIDAISSASKVETRHSEAPSIVYSHQGVVASASYYNSIEPDYFSMAPAASLAWDFNGRNTTVGGNVAQFFDHYKPFGKYANQGGKKYIRSLGATLAQSLTPLTLIGFTASYITSWGYLGHPYNPPIDTNGIMREEKIPGRKVAGAFASQIVQGYHIGDRLGSFNIDFRLFQDSWGIKSKTADIKWHQYFADGWYFRLRTRLYDQGGAQFAKENYHGQETYQTADIRFFPFKSLLVGGKIAGPFPESWGHSAMLPDSWDLKYDHVVRNTSGDPAASPSGAARRVLYQLYEPDEYYMQGIMMAGLNFNL